MTRRELLALINSGEQTEGRVDVRVDGDVLDVTYTPAHGRQDEVEHAAWRLVPTNF